MERRLAESRTAELRTAGPRVMVNGRPRELGEVGGHVTLLEWLRGSGLTGCKEGCAEGECGACAVLVARDDGTDRTRWVAINACLVPAAAFDEQEVVTAEGLGRPGRLHPVQREMAERGGSQCGYCTPGFICSMAAEYYRPGRQTAVTGAPGHGPNGSGTPRHRQRRAPGRGRKRRRGARPERLRSARAQRQPVPLHRLPADQGRGLCPGPARGGRPVPGPAGRTRAGPGRHHELEHPGPLRPPGRPNRGIGAAGRRAGRPAGGRVHRLGRRAEHQAHQGRADHRHRPDRRAARAHRGPGQHRHRRRAEPDRDRDQARRAGCRCSASCSRSSRRG